ncbi:MAG: exonuclease SbcCD subunit D C-terminal domain-containing protein [Chitinophaga sp.]|uniref:exonuclease SbcCD subunit D n=1 Tax=Chitinophaga sp. TaxID=1869181 RepID=UPI0025BFC6C6|nr:exonuclease SbcCD subunit D C-terminal domain-containing protein [Chitinophaga sp.]MBV8253675.1 exonuclease SbcCD subunit D C-terminal domain-containing protein [Chitinophaga sp.]
MKVLHTADWHIGQLFHEYDRTYEHQQFLDWLLQTLINEKIDVLLISGDVFDVSNPAASAVRMLYTFLANAARNNPALQIIMTAGNHDSAARLESPKPLLESSNIHIIGVVERDAFGNIDYDKLTIPIKDTTGNPVAWCLAVPFLRMGDYPEVASSDNPYTAGVAAMYEQVYQHVLQYRKAGQPIIAMGHMHTQQAEITELDKTERLIMGGVECVSTDAFHEDIKYVALGHIHKSQRIGGKEHIRYSGSPLPMSFSEFNYRHQVILFNLEGEGISAPTTLEVPVSVGLQRIPSVHSNLSEVLMALEKLPANGAETDIPAPYLEVRVLLEGPEPALRHKIESTLQGKHIRLAKIDVKYTNGHSSVDAPETIAGSNLQELQPQDIFAKAYQVKYNNPVPAELLQLFHEVAQEVNHTDN